MQTDDSDTHVHSLDGRSFEGSVPLAMPVLVGDLVLLSQKGGRTLLGQVLKKSAQGRQAGVAGAIRASVLDGRDIGRVDPLPFDEAQVSAAPADVVSRFQTWAGADMAVGTIVSGYAEQVAASVRRTGFNRHTFLCGQSGSGKTYTLGVLLEHLLAETGLRMVVVDPNADFVGLGRARDDADPASAARLAGADVKVLRVGPDGADDRLAMLFRELTTPAKAAILRVDPLHDRTEYNDLLRVLDSSVRQEEVQAFADSISSADGGLGEAVVQRIQNLGVLDWQVWGHGGASFLEALAGRPRALVMDVSPCRVPAERYAVAVALLDRVWDERENRDPVLVVIDEAHNVCAASPEDPLQVLATERLVQIAGEGRKYGIWLLLSTQQPGKIHPNVLSQCDNVVVLRMNSTADLAQLGEAFGTAPPQMLAMAPGFRQGEMLLAGSFVAAPMIATIGQRVTVEGGSDVKVPLQRASAPVTAPVTEALR